MNKTELLNLTKEELVDIIYKSMCDKDNLIKYLEDKIKKLKDECASLGHIIDKDTMQKFDLQINAYQDVLERLKSGKYE